MCGIAGFYSLKSNRNKSEQAAIGHRLEQAIAHRGPDASAIWQDDNAPLTLCHRRLAIIDLSEGGRQPMHSHSGRYVVAYNGEIYNYLSLQKELEAAGIKFNSRSDTEVMLAAFEYWGINEALQKLNGMFAIALWDKQEKQLHFIRDRFGKKPLYIGWAGNDLVFASELKSFHAHPDFQKSINHNVLAQYMKYGYVHAPSCIFDGIWQLLPAARMSLDVGSLKVSENLSDKMQIYWSLKSVAEQGKAHISQKIETQIIDEFEGKLETAVSERMISDVPLGAFLSGGIDSSTIVALMQKKSSAPTKTFSIGFKEAGFNEAEHAKLIAQNLETDHQEFYVSAQDALDVIPNLPDIYDEPFADASQIPTYLISKLARDKVTVVLTGDGGDEILGGYDRHTKIPALWARVKWMPHGIRKIIMGALAHLPDTVFQSLKPESPLFPTQVKRALNLMGHRDAQAIYDALMTNWSGNIVIEGSAPLCQLNDPHYWPKNLSFAEEMIFGDTLSYRPNDLMVKADRATMAVALEGRAPLMDYKLAEYCWTLPHSMKIRESEGKWLLRQVLQRHVPKALYDRPKMGFSVPIGDWLRGDLKNWAEALLSLENLERHGFFDNESVQKSWDEFLNSPSKDAPKHIWTILMFQAWYEKWMT